MFNPQRKAKVADIYMQEKVYSLHLKKMDEIQRSLSTKARRYTQETKQQHNLLTLHKSKKEIKDRENSNIKNQNKKLFKRLIETDSRKDDSLSPGKEKKHFNSYFTNKKQKNRLVQDNYAMVVRMNQLSPSVPSLKQLKREFKKNKKLSKNCRKLPAILRNQEQYKTKISQPVIQNSRTLNIYLGK